MKDVFVRLCAAYSNDETLVAHLWQEVESCYSATGRYYHNMEHLVALIGELDEVKHLIANWNSVLFALYYHDIVYNVLRNDNEEQSAQIATQRLRQLGVPGATISDVNTLILATKSHASVGNADVDYFTDADLSVLGRKSAGYKQYAQQVRREYGIYPALLYKPGRKKVLQHFLQMERIFKTDWFYQKYESPARKNLQAELDGTL